MIFQETESGWLAISQPGHAWVCGQLARAWNEDLPEPLILATSLHDIGWKEWDEAPPLHPEGRPLNFTEASFEDTIGHWERAVSKMSVYNPYATVLVSKHANTVFRVRMERGFDPAPESQKHLQYQQDLQNRLIAEMHFDAAQIDAHYDILRACDLLVLAICTGPLKAGRADHGAIKILYQPVDEHTLALAPFPLRSSLEVTVEARELSQKTFPDVTSYHAALHAAPWRYLRFKFVAAEY